MQTVKKIKKAITALPQKEIDEVSEWIAELKSDLWDKQIEEDVRAGKLDKLAEQAMADFEAGLCKKI